MNKPQTYNGDLGNLPAALVPFTSERRWVCWRWKLDKKRSKWTKPPYQAGQPSRLAKANDNATWGAYETAVRAVEAGNCDGIGIVLRGSVLGAADLDHCRDAATGTIDEWAQERIDAAHGYSEITVSGTGTRILGLVRGQPMHRKFAILGRSGAAIELYRDAPRYVTVSGLEIGYCLALSDIDAFLDQELARLDRKKHAQQDDPLRLQRSTAGSRNAGTITTPSSAKRRTGRTAPSRSEYSTALCSKPGLTRPDC